MEFYCENCGEYTLHLRRVDGTIVCNECLQRSLVYQIND